MIDLALATIVHEMCFWTIAFMLAVCALGIWRIGGKL